MQSEITGEYLERKEESAACQEVTGAEIIVTGM